MTVDSVNERRRQIWSTVVGTGCLALILIRWNTWGNLLAIDFRTFTDFGFPLTYCRNYSRGNTAPHLPSFSTRDPLLVFSPQALAFDASLAALAVGGFSFLLFARSKSWSSRQHLAFQLLSVAAASPWLGQLPMPLALLALLGLLAVPVASLWGMGYGAWWLAEHRCGAGCGWIGQFSLTAAIFACGYASTLRDPYTFPTQDDVPTFLANLTNENPQVRSMSLQALGGTNYFMTEDEASLEPLIVALRDENWAVRSTASSIIRQMGPKADIAVPTLVDLFKENRSDASTLGALGPAAVEAIPLLKERLRTAKGYQKLSIAQALWNIEQNTSESVPALIELHDDEFGPIQREAAQLLGQIGPAARDAVPRLMEMVEYQPQANLPPTVRPDSKGPPTVRPMTEDEFYPQIREAAAKALTRIDPHAMHRR